MPKLDGILETAIHTEDMVRARAFYEGVLGLEPIYSDNRLSAYAVAGRDVLLVFRKGTTGQTVVLPSGTIPGHGGDGVLHVAFAIGKDELDLWEAHGRYSINSSARSRSASGRLRPSALAVLRLITSSNFTGCSIGKSAGFAPFKTFCT